MVSHYDIPIFPEKTSGVRQLVLHCVLWYKRLNVILSRKEYVTSALTGRALFDCKILWFWESENLIVLEAYFRAMHCSEQCRMYNTQKE